MGVNEKILERRPKIDILVYLHIKKDFTQKFYIMILSSSLSCEILTSN